MVVTSHIATEHGSFSCISQVAPICTPSNIWFLGPTQVTLQWYFTWFNCFCRAHLCDQGIHTNKNTDHTHL